MRKHLALKFNPRIELRSMLGLACLGGSLLLGACSTRSTSIQSDESVGEELQSKYFDHFDEENGADNSKISFDFGQSDQIDQASNTSKEYSKESLTGLLRVQEVNQEMAAIDGVEFEQGEQGEQAQTDISNQRTIASQSASNATGLEYQIGATQEDGIEESSLELDQALELQFAEVQEGAIELNAPQQVRASVSNRVMAPTMVSNETRQKIESESDAIDINQPYSLKGYTRAPNSVINPSDWIVIGGAEVVDDGAFEINNPKLRVGGVLNIAHQSDIIPQYEGIAIATNYQEKESEYFLKQEDLPSEQSRRPATAHPYVVHDQDLSSKYFSKLKTLYPRQKDRDLAHSQHPYVVFDPQAEARGIKDLPSSSRESAVEQELYVSDAFEINAPVYSQNLADEAEELQEFEPFEDLILEDEPKAPKEDLELKDSEQGLLVNPFEEQILKTAAEKTVKKEQHHLKETLSQINVGSSVRIKAETIKTKQVFKEQLRFAKLGASKELKGHSLEETSKESLKKKYRFISTLKNSKQGKQERLKKVAEKKPQLYTNNTQSSPQKVEVKEAVSHQRTDLPEDLMPLDFLPDDPELFSKSRVLPREDNDKILQPLGEDFETTPVKTTQLTAELKNSYEKNPRQEILDGDFFDFPAEEGLDRVLSLPFVKRGALLNSYYFVRPSDKDYRSLSKSIFGTKSWSKKLKDWNDSKPLEIGSIIYYNSQIRSDDRERMLVFSEDQSWGSVNFKVFTNKSAEEIAEEYLGNRVFAREIAQINNLPTEKSVFERGSFVKLQAKFKTPYLAKSKKFEQADYVQKRIVDRAIRKLPSQFKVKSSYHEKKLYSQIFNEAEKIAQDDRVEAFLFNEGTR